MGQDVLRILLNLKALGHFCNNSQGLVLHCLSSIPVLAERGYLNLGKYPIYFLTWEILKKLLPLHITFSLSKDFHIYFLSTSQNPLT